MINTATNAVVATLAVENAPFSLGQLIVPAAPAAPSAVLTLSEWVMILFAPMRAGEAALVLQRRQMAA